MSAEPSLYVNLIASKGVNFFVFKGIVSRDFEWLQMILMNTLCVPDVPLEVLSFLNLHLHMYSFLIFNFTAG